MSDYKLQVNVALGDYLLNVNGLTAEELASHLKQLSEMAPELMESLNSIKQAGFAVEAFKGGADKIPAAPGTPPSTETPHCKHGIMKDLQGKKNAKGQPYKNRYYCAAEYDAPDKCAARD